MRGIREALSGWGFRQTTREVKTTFYVAARE